MSEESGNIDLLPFLKANLTHIEGTDPGVPDEIASLDFIGKHLVFYTVMINNETLKEDSFLVEILAFVDLEEQRAKMNTPPKFLDYKTYQELPLWKVTAGEKSVYELP